MRKLVLSVVIASGLSMIGAAPAGAAGPRVKELPPAACNQGTENAHHSVPAGRPGHPHIPHFMGFA